jgi:hypothetical protein
LLILLQLSEYIINYRLGVFNQPSIHGSREKQGPDLQWKSVERISLPAGIVWNNVGVIETRDSFPRMG